MKSRVWISFLWVVLAGCASQPKIDPDIDWAARVGHYTYPQAVTELGRPSVTGESSEGRTAEWMRERNAGVSFGLGVGHGSFNPRTGVGVGVGTTVRPPRQWDHLRLTFGPDGQLKSWARQRR